jgi:hypothetical protein
MPAITAAVFAVQAIGAAALPHVGHSIAGAAACVIAFGLGFGVATFARPAIVTARYGTARYATVAGALALPITLAKAVAPLGAALLPPGRFLTAAAIACLIAATLLASMSRGQSVTADGNLRLVAADVRRPGGRPAGSAIYQPGGGTRWRDPAAAPADRPGAVRGGDGDPRR